jgi:hypothetical protein
MYKTIFLRGEGTLCSLSRQHASQMPPAIQEAGPAKRKEIEQSLVMTVSILR